DRRSRESCSTMWEPTWCASLRTNALLPALQPRLGSGRQAERSDDQEPKDEQHRHEQLRAPGSHRRGKPREPERRSQYDDRIEAGALPVITVEMQPHPELVEGEAETDTIDHGGIGRRRFGAKEEIGSYAGEQKDAVIQVMDVDVVDIEVNVGHLREQHEDADEPRGDERQHEAQEDAPRERSSIGREHGLPSRLY